MMKMIILLLHQETSYIIALMIQKYMNHTMNLLILRNYL
nr:MAG TPA: hypothetical protein [Caudoviricetes sp.]